MWSIFCCFAGNQVMQWQPSALTLPLALGWGYLCLRDGWVGCRRLIAAGLALAFLAVSALDAPRLLKTAHRLGPEAVWRTQLLVNEMRQEAQASDLSKLEAMNSFFNRNVVYEDDQVIWGRMDYWTSPIELLNRGVGDCEDYALAKYFTLIAMGIPPAKMRMVYVRAELGGAVLAHMVLAYYPAPNAEPLILDNLISELRPASRRTDLAPVFSFNAQGLWQGVGLSSAGDPVARLSKWRDVLARAKSEGWW
jgi:predicted transglutaminase-like cysteine proteinase